MLRCPLSSDSSDHDSADLLRLSRCRVGEGKGGGGANKVGVALRAGKSLLGVELWASG